MSTRLGIARGARDGVRQVARSTDGPVTSRGRGHLIPPGRLSAVLGLPARAYLRDADAAPTYPDTAWPRYGSRRRYRAALRRVPALYRCDPAGVVSR